MSLIKVFVGSLPPGLTEDVLKAYLSPFGQMSSCMLKAEQRYAFAFYGDMQTAQQAIAGMNGLVIGSTPIVAKLAKNPGAPGSQGVAAPVAVAPLVRGAPSPVQRAPIGSPGERVYIKGLPAGMSDDQVRMIFAGYGNVVDSKVLVADGQSSDGAGQSVAIVRMGSAAEAQWLVDNLNGNIPETLNRPIEVSFAGARGASGPERPAPYGAAAGYSPFAPMPGAPPPPASRPPVWASAAVAPAMPVAIVGRSVGQHSVHPNVMSLKGTCTPNSKLYVKGLPADADDAYLYRIFAPWGRVAEAVACPKGDYCIGFVQYLTDEEANEGIANVNGVTLLDGVTLTVSVKAQK